MSRRGRGLRVAVVALVAAMLPGCGVAGTSREPVSSPSPTTTAANTTTTPSAPVSDAGGAPSPATSSTAVPSGPPSASESSATPSGSATSSPPTPSRRVPVIVVDPGHSGAVIRRTDPSTGLQDIDYPNYPEIYEMFDVSTCLAQALRRDGYRVLLTKRHALSSVGHRARADLAGDHQADLAVSVHDDHGQGPHFEATYSQRGVPDARGRYPTMYRGLRKDRTVYRRPSVASRSETAARLIARARTRLQHRRVSVTQNSFDGREPLEPGNLALVQLFSRVPWVYNEMGARTGRGTRQAMSIASERGYTAGLLAGVELAVPRRPGEQHPSTSSTASLTRCLVRQVEPRPGHFARPRADRPAGFAADRDQR